MRERATEMQVETPSETVEETPEDMPSETASETAPPDVLARGSALDAWKRGGGVAEVWSWAGIGEAGKRGDAEVWSWGWKGYESVVEWRKGVKGEEREGDGRWVGEWSKGGK